jgi:4a-hydroxytetrahydrobiopterin dehydratase
MLLSLDDVRERLNDLPGWRVVDNALVRQYRFETFPYAVAFVTTLGFDAEARDHHPDLLVSYKRVTVTWTTHSEHGLTEKDFVGARESDRLARVMGHTA